MADVHELMRRYREADALFAEQRKRHTVAERAVRRARERQDAAEREFLQARTVLLDAIAHGEFDG